MHSKKQRDDKGKAMPIRIITDSASDIVSGECPENLTVLPMTITFGETTYHDGVDITHERFYEMLVESDALPTTGQVTPYEYGQALAAAREAGEDVVILTVSSKLSGTYQSACFAAGELEEAGAAGESGAAGVDPAPVRCRVVDTESASVGERVLVELALQLVEEGLSADEVADRLEERKRDVRVVALLDTLEYLRKGGRISLAAGAVGAMLAIKPVVAIEGGEIAVLGKARGSKNGKNLLTQQIEKSGGIDFGQPLALGYTGLSRRLLDKYIDDSRGLWEQSVESLLCYSIGATVGTHAGPGAIALAFFRKA